jgi:hypothetical protein
MGKISDMIKELAEKEKLDAYGVFKKYPHLITLQKEELFEEYKSGSLNESSKKGLLLD